MEEGREGEAGRAAGMEGGKREEWAEGERGKGRDGPLKNSFIKKLFNLYKKN